MKYIIIITLLFLPILLDGQDTLMINSIEIYGRSTNCIQAGSFLRHLDLIQKCEIKNSQIEGCNLCDTINKKDDLLQLQALLNDLEAPNLLKKIIHQRQYKYAGSYPLVLVRINYTDNTQKFLFIDSNHDFIKVGEEVYKFDKRIIELLLSYNDGQPTENLKSFFEIKSK